MFYLFNDRVFCLLYVSSVLGTISSSTLLISLSIDIYSKTNSSFYASAVYMSFWILGVILTDKFAKISSIPNSFFIPIMVTCGCLLSNYYIYRIYDTLWYLLLIVSLRGALELLLRNIANVIVKRYVVHNLHKQTFSFYNSSKNIGACFAGLVVVFFNEDLLSQILSINFLTLSMMLLTYCVLAIYITKYRLGTEQTCNHVSDNSPSLTSICRDLMMDSDKVRHNIYYNAIGAILFALHHILRVFIPSKIFTNVEQCVATIQIVSVSAFVLSAILVTKNVPFARFRLWVYCTVELFIILGLFFSTNIYATCILYFIFIFLQNTIWIRSFSEIMFQSTSGNVGYVSSILNSGGILVVVLSMLVISYTLDWIMSMTLSQSIHSPITV